ncbi:MAG: DUF4919 domain-containing protein [Flavipsychrobacter sp.]
MIGGIEKNHGIGKWLVVILLLHLTYVASAQVDFQKPDYEAIKEIVRDTSSYYHYPHLFALYQAGDEQLDLKAYRMLYYGHLYERTYVSQSYSDYVSARLELYALSKKKNLKGKKLERVIELTKDNLKSNPFSISNLVILNIMLEKMGKKNEAKKYLTMATGIRDAIMSTGDGRSDTTAYHISNIEHEYDMLWVLDLEFTGERKLTSNNCDYTKVKQNEEGIEGVYFNVQRIYSNKED